MVGCASSMGTADALIVPEVSVKPALEPTPEPTPAPDARDAWLATEFPAADGFDFPVGGPDGDGAYTAPDGRRHRGWKVDTRLGDVYPLGIHNGEDWNGVGGGDSDLGQPVTAIAHGRVVHAGEFGAPWGNIVVVEHVFYENHHRRVVESSYAHLDVIDEGVFVGAILKRGDVLGTLGKGHEGTFLAHLHLEIRAKAGLSPTFWPSSHGWSAEEVREAYLPPTEFIEARRRLFVPQDEPLLLLVDHDTDTLRRIEHGEVVGEYAIGFGQAEGRKRLEGDLKTPKGMYFVVQRTRGDIGGRWGAFYGGHWIKVNYPNAYDAAWGVEQGFVEQGVADRIARSWRARELTDQKTALGSGIGFHGWINDWSLDGSRGLSWGCVVFQNADITALYDDIVPGTMVVMR